MTTSMEISDSVAASHFEDKTVPARVAILGAGAVTRIFYLPLLRRSLKNLQLQAIIDPSKITWERLPQFSDCIEKFHGTYEAYFAQLKVGELDGVIIALPHYLHEPAVTSALQRGLNVFCEKPLGLTAASVLAMQDAAVQAGVALTVCQPRRSFFAASTIREVLQTGWLGKMTSASWEEGQPYAWPAESLAQVFAEHGGGELYDIGAHAFDLLSWWFGDLEVTSYRDDANGGTAAEYQVSLKTQFNVPISVSLSRLKLLKNCVVIQCERGRISWHLIDPDKVHVQLETPLSSRPFVISSGYPPTRMVDAIQEQLVEFSNSVAGNDNCAATAEDAMKYVKIFDACRSHQKLSQRIKINNRERSVVTGASGFIGTRLVEMLHERGRPTTAIARRPQSCSRMARVPVDLRLADITSTGSLDPVFREGGNTLYHCAVASGSKQVVWDTIVKGTQNVLEAAEKHGFRRAIVFSSMLAYGDPPGFGVVDESCNFRPSDMEYAKAKYAMEEQCRTFAAKSKLEVVILEPTCVFGPFGKDFGTAHLDSVLDETFVLFNGGAGSANLIFVDNLVDAAIHSADIKCASGMKFILNEEEDIIEWREYFSELMMAAFAYDIDWFPSLTVADLQYIEKHRRQQRSFPQVLRNAVRNHIPSQDWLATNRLFQFWKTRRRITSAVAKDCDPVAFGVSEKARYPDKKLILSRFLNADKFYLNSSVGQFFASNTTFKSSKFRQLTGWSPKVKRADAMRQTCDWAQDAYAVQRQQLVDSSLG